jgi:hypothetical protein
MTNLPPAAVLDTSTAWQPVAWKRGTERRLAFCAPSPTPPTGPERRRLPVVATKNRFIRLDTLLRWVPTAPLGRPVVPDV